MAGTYVDPCLTLTRFLLLDPFQRRQPLTPTLAPASPSICLALHSCQEYHSIQWRQALRHCMTGVNLCVEGTSCSSTLCMAGTSNCVPVQRQPECSDNLKKQEVLHGWLNEAINHKFLYSWALSAYTNLAYKTCYAWNSQSYAATSYSPIGVHWN